MMLVLVYFGLQEHGNKACQEETRQGKCLSFCMNCHGDMNCLNDNSLYARCTDLVF